MLYDQSKDLVFSLPESVFLIGLLSLLIWAVFLATRKDITNYHVSTLTMMVTYLLIELHSIMIILLWKNFHIKRALFFNTLLNDNYSIMLKSLLIIFSILFLSLALNYLCQTFLKEFEALLLVTFSIFASFILLSSNDLITLYLGIEAQSLCLYVLAAMRKTSQFSSEAGLKYFILGALSSSLLLFGMSFIYGTIGSTNFDVITKTLSSLVDRHECLPAMLIIGFICVLCSLLFKIAAVPFHMWSPDVYEGSPLPIMVFFATVPKIALTGLLIKLLYSTFWDLHLLWKPVLTLTATLTLLFSSLATFYQKKVKRFLAYSSINHMGYMLMGMSTGTLLGAHAFFIYMIIYLITMLTFFGLILSLRKKTGKDLTYLIEFLQIQQAHPILRCTTILVLFSMTGIPPLIGFFSKFYIFLSAVDIQSFILVIIGMLCSTLSAFYYIRLIKIMNFDQSHWWDLLSVQWTDNLRIYIIFITLIIILCFMVPHIIFTSTYYLILSL